MKKKTATTGGFQPTKYKDVYKMILDFRFQDFFSHPHLLESVKVLEACRGNDSKYLWSVIKAGVPSHFVLSPSP
jgi:hypothetical protein